MTYCFEASNLLRYLFQEQLTYREVKKKATQNHSRVSSRDKLANQFQNQTNKKKGTAEFQVDVLTGASFPAGLKNSQ